MKRLLSIATLCPNAHQPRFGTFVARQMEALAALGKLAAGLAHELNNPAAAATRAVDALGEAYEGLLSSLRRLAEGSLPTACLPVGRAGRPATPCGVEGSVK